MTFRCTLKPCVYICQSKTGLQFEVQFLVTKITINYLNVTQCTFKPKKNYTKKSTMFFLSDSAPRLFFCPRFIIFALDQMMILYNFLLHYYEINLQSLYKTWSNCITVCSVFSQSPKDEYLAHSQRTDEIQSGTSEPECAQKDISVHYADHQFIPTPNVFEDYVAFHNSQHI